MLHFLFKKRKLVVACPEWKASCRIQVNNTTDIGTSPPRNSSICNNQFRCIVKINIRQIEAGDINTDDIVLIDTVSVIIVDVITYRCHNIRVSVRPISAGRLRLCRCPRRILLPGEIYHNTVVIVKPHAEIGGNVGPCVKKLKRIISFGVFIITKQRITHRFNIAITYHNFVPRVVHAVRQPTNVIVSCDKNLYPITVVVSAIYVVSFIAKVDQFNQTSFGNGINTKTCGNRLFDDLAVFDKIEMLNDSPSRHLICKADIAIHTFENIYFVCRQAIICAISVQFPHFFINQALPRL